MDHLIGLLLWICFWLNQRFVIYFWKMELFATLYLHLKLKYFYALVHKQTMHFTTRFYWLFWEKRHNITGFEYEANGVFFFLSNICQRLFYLFYLFLANTATGITVFSFSNLLHTHRWKLTKIYHSYNWKFIFLI